MYNSFIQLGYDTYLPQILDFRLRKLSDDTFPNIISEDINWFNENFISDAKP